MQRNSLLKARPIFFADGSEFGEVPCANETVDFYRERTITETGKTRPCCIRLDFGVPVKQAPDLGQKEAHLVGAGFVTQAKGKDHFRADGVFPKLSAAAGEDFGI